jgi:hypothetical protein
MLITNKLIEAKNLLTPTTWSNSTSEIISNSKKLCAGIALGRVSLLNVELEDKVRELFISVNCRKDQTIVDWNDTSTYEQVQTGFDSAIEYAGILGI